MTEAPMLTDADRAAAQAIADARPPFPPDQADRLRILLGMSR